MLNARQKMLKAPPNTLKASRTTLIVPLAPLNALRHSLNTPLASPKDRFASQKVPLA